MKEKKTTVAYRKQPPPPQDGGGGKEEKNEKGKRESTTNSITTPTMQDWEGAKEAAKSNTQLQRRNKKQTKKNPITLCLFL